MKNILKNLGLVVIILGVIFLSIVVFKQSNSNSKLIISLILIVGGLFGHIVLNRYIE